MSGDPATISQIIVGIMDEQETQSGLDPVAASALLDHRWHSMRDGTATMTLDDLEVLALAVGLTPSAVACRAAQVMLSR